ncbi:MAG: HDOD domain-containing protein [Pseudomonadota bacterium]
MKEIGLQELTAAVERMPAFPKSVQEILRLSREVNCTPKDLVQVIESDPLITVKILKTVNSAYYGVAKPMTSVAHALLYLGANTIKNLAISIAALGMLPSKNVAGLEMPAYLLHCLSCAEIAKRLALKLDGTLEPMDAYLAGLLHDFGKIVLALFMPEAFQAALDRCQQDGSSLHQALRATLGTDHAQLGAMLVEHWRFSTDISTAIRYQYGAELSEPELSQAEQNRSALNLKPLISCVFAANQISKALQFGAAGNPCVEAFPPFVIACLGGDRDAVIASLGDLTPVLAEAQFLSNLGAA